MYYSKGNLYQILFSVYYASNNFGWVVNKTYEGANGKLEFGTRETEYTPTLIMVFDYK